MESANSHTIRIFLCYASDDKSFARELYKKLVNYEFDVWFDEERLLPGQNWDIEIQKSVRLADVVLICLSGRSVNKEGYVQKEIKIALDIAEEKPEGAIFIIPIRIEDCFVPERIKPWQWIDLFSSENKTSSNNFEKLIKSLKLRASQKEKRLSFGDVEKLFTPSAFYFLSNRAWIFPNYKNILDETETPKWDENKISYLARALETTLSSLNVPAQVMRISIGPRYIRFGVEPLFRINKKSEKIKVSISNIVAADKDIASAMGVKDVQINLMHERNFSYIGIDMHHSEDFSVRLLSIVESQKFLTEQKPHTLILGRDVEGYPIYLNLSRFSNVLIGGTIRSGRSTCLTGCICSLLINNSPNEVKIILVDTRRVEFSMFSGLPHLIAPAINDKPTILSSFRWLLDDIKEREGLFSKFRVRNIDEYNARVRFEEKLPQLVMFISELSDLIEPTKNELQILLSKISGAARVTGIHVIAATQQLSPAILTDTIKQSFSDRIALKTISGSDSSNIIEQPGAEKLLGNGDMFFLRAGINEPVRLQGLLISDYEVNQLVNSWKSQII